MVNDKIAWISGSAGQIAITRDGGSTWNWQQVKGFEKADFRDVEAFSDKEAVIIASGTPAVVLKTVDGGTTWQTVFRKDEEAYFLDAMDFSDKKHGWILGDPIDGKFLVLATADGGSTWQQVTKSPVALNGEAAFAASGTCLRVHNKELFIVTGGLQTRLIQGNSQTYDWTYTDLPVTHGKSSQGAFSLALNGKAVMVAGGNYEQDRKIDSLACYAPKSGAAFELPGTPPVGYQSCVEHVKGLVYLATGTPGSCITTDGGKTWKQIDATSFNVCRKAKRGNWILLAGNGGKIATVKF